MDVLELIVTLYTALTAVFGEDTTIGARIVSLVSLAVVITGTASYIFQILEKIADLTPTDKDNEYLGKAQRALAYVIAILDRIAVNPDKEHARDAEE